MGRPKGQLVSYMAESGASAHPTTLTPISSADVSSHILTAIDAPSRWLSGMDISWVGLTLTVEAGETHIKGKHCVFTADVSEALVNTTTNHVYTDKNADIIVNQTGIAPANSIKLWEVVTAGGAVTGTTDFRDNTIDLSSPLMAPGFDVEGAKITNVATGTISTDGVNKGQMDTAIAAATVADASTTVKGITKLSVAPAVAANPIAVGDNDTRATDVTAATSAATINTLVRRNGSGQAAFGDGVNADHAVSKGQLDANATADRARANHTGTQLAATISNFDTQVRTNRLDQMAAPTASVSLNGQRATDGGAPTAATDFVRLQDIGGAAISAPATYAGVDSTTLPASGELVSQGLLIATPTSDGGVLPGMFGQGPQNMSKRVFLLTSFGGSSVPAFADIPRGSKYSVKGVYRARADAPLAAAEERVTLGVVFGATIGAASINSIGNETETTRDDLATIAVVVDDSENIKSYNCAVAGDATYTDSGFDADLSVKMAWEIIIETPGTANSNDDILVTVRVMDSGGTMRTILSAAVPVSTGTGTPAVPFFIINQDGFCTKVVAKLERATAE